MKKSFRKVIGSIDYLVEVWVKPKPDYYLVGIQAVPRVGKPYPFAIRLSEEFIEDFLDNDKKIEYLEKLSMQVAEDHLEDMMKLQPTGKIANTNYWFRDAKIKVDKKE